MANDLKLRVNRDLSDAEVELAAATARAKAQVASKSSLNGSVTSDDLAALQAQVSSLREQSKKLEIQVTSYSALFEKRRQQRELLDKEIQAAQAQYESAQLRKTELLSSTAFRGERLEIIDPGVVPERPSSPNIALNLLVALVGSLGCSVLYLALRFSHLRVYSTVR
jgi:uncharacterized protein involved in exopolysaccharide biosynthesis